MKRAAAGLLWLIAIAAVGNAIVLFTGIPSVVSPIAAVAVSAFVLIDPMHWFWPVASKRSTAGMPASSLQVSAK
jgi:hypothetical protein